MKKVVVSLVLGIALLAVSRVANAEQPRGAEPRWGLRQDRTSVSSPLDLARWLARRLNEEMAVPVPLPAPNTPKSSPYSGPTPNDDTDEVCIPERSHCPIH